ncbi:MAG: flagellar protein FlaG [Gammaproteobacteria bacterium]|nr:flagellar protein FlaG [Gammaproteobacteria bacterium]
MADFNVNTELPNLSAINGFVRKNLVQPLQSSQKANSNNSTEDDVDKKARQDIASGLSLSDSVDKSAVKEELDETISQLNDSLQNVQRNLEFSVDKDAGRIVINVKDKETDEVLRQIPSEEVLELARNLHNINAALNQEINERNESYSSSQSAAEGVFLKTSV